MKKTNIGNYTSNVFFQIGNGMNMSTFMRPQKKINKKIIMDTNLALKSDWNIVGKEIGNTFDKFEGKYSTNKRKITGERICITSR